MKKTTNQELRTYLKKLGYEKPVADDELSAIRRVMLIAEIGVAVNHQHIERELKITREHNQLKQEVELACDAEWLDLPTVHDNVNSVYGTLDLGTHVVISGGEVLELGEQTGDGSIPF